MAQTYLKRAIDVYPVIESRQSLASRIMAIVPRFLNNIPLTSWDWLAFIMLMQKKLFLLLIALFMMMSIQSRVHIRRIGPDNRTEEQKQKEQQEGMTYGIIIAIVIGGLVIWGKVRNS